MLNRKIGGALAGLGVAAVIGWAVRSTATEFSRVVADESRVVSQSTDIPAGDSYIQREGGAYRLVQVKPDIHLVVPETATPFPLIPILSAVAAFFDADDFGPDAWGLAAGGPNAGFVGTDGQAHGVYGGWRAELAPAGLGSLPVGAPMLMEARLKTPDTAFLNNYPNSTR